MTCRCDAYTFPHRHGGGQCPGHTYVCECGWSGGYLDLNVKIKWGDYGHPDNWLPDEVYRWCPRCGSEEITNMEDGE